MSCCVVLGVSFRVVDFCCLEMFKLMFHQYYILKKLKLRSMYGTFTYICSMFMVNVGALNKPCMDPMGMYQL